MGPEPSDSKVMTVKADTCISIRNNKNEKEILDIGCSSQIQEESANKDEKKPANNYKIHKEPTTTFEFKIPKKQSTTNVERSTTTVENVVKYSEAIPLSIGENNPETVPLKKKSLNNIPIPPPPKSKPPPPPPSFKPPPP